MSNERYMQKKSNRYEFQKEKLSDIKADIVFFNYAS